MKTRRLYVFNPEHDLALAAGKGSYTPPEAVGRLRREMALLPAQWAGDSDFIYTPASRTKTKPENEPANGSGKTDGLRCPEELQDRDFRGRVLGPEDINEEIINEIGEIRPWGWDFAIKRELVEAGFPEELMPDESRLEAIRELSHRKTAIKFREKIGKEIPDSRVNFPVELKSDEELKEYLESNKGIVYFKAPWSSSGRGIVVTDHIKRKGLLEWTHGIIKKQGSVIAEPAWDRVIDFATEWWVKESKANFLGVSVFETSSRGKYHGNMEGSQEELWGKIREKTKEFDEWVIEAQRRVIDLLISPEYEGPLGIDMLADREGRINPCVEINLRLTMGIVEIWKRLR